MSWLFLLDVDNLALIFPLGNNGEVFDKTYVSKAPALSRSRIWYLEVRACAQTNAGLTPRRMHVFHIFRPRTNTRVFVEILRSLQTASLLFGMQRNNSGYTLHVYLVESTVFYHNNSSPSVMAARPHRSSTSLLSSLV